MNVQKIVCIGASLMALSICQAYEWETQGMVGYYFPSDGLWDNGWSGEAKIIAWEDDIGYAVSAGMMQWDVENKKNVAKDTYLLKVWDTWQGDVQYFPLGASLLQRYDLEEGDTGPQKLQFEAGLHYLFASGDLEVVRTRDTWIGPGSTYSTTHLPASASIDSALVLRLGGSYLWSMGEDTFGLMSGGYQFDITQGDATADSLGVRQELDLSAFYIHFGVGFLWQ